MVRPSPATANHKRSLDLTMAIAMRDWTAKNDKCAFGTGLRHGCQTYTFAECSQYCHIVWLYSLTEGDLLIFPYIFQVFLVLVLAWLVVAVW